MGQRVTTKDGRTWFLEPGAPFLDFVFTGDLGTGDPWWEQLHTAFDLTSWLNEHVSSDIGAATRDDLANAHALRAILSRVAMNVPRSVPVAPADWAALARAAAEPDVPPSLPGFPPGPLPAGRGLATLARDAVIHLRDHPERLRVCAAADCPLVFLDLSRSGNRQWCSMARCGNRAKARAFHARLSQQEGRS